MNENVWPLILLGGGLLAFLLVVSFLSKNYSLNNFPLVMVSTERRAGLLPRRFARPIM